MPLEFQYPTPRGCNFVGGNTIQPELMALLLGLVIHAGAFIAEIVCAGIQGVPNGQKEAAERAPRRHSAGDAHHHPATDQQLPQSDQELLARGGHRLPGPRQRLRGTVLNQTGQAVEVILITMLVYLSLSLLTSLFMNWFNVRMALVARCGPCSATWQQAPSTPRARRVSKSA
jgi:general L-amino acid transport system permease protein